jgi:oxygen-independent coproporphyrinogen III oxidase
VKFNKFTSDTGLYIHIPICSKRCSYCDFYSETNISYSFRKKLVNKIKQQISYFTDKTGSPEISTVYIGGGTPTILETDIIKDLLNFTLKLNEKGIERTIEANPESLDENKLNILYNQGITRLSIGVQSFNKGLLTILGRNASAEDNYRALSILKRNPGIKINIDLISGIPGQTDKMLKDDLKRIIDAGINHISLYSLTIPEGSLLEKNIKSGRIKKNPVEDDIWLSACSYLKSNGYEQYEISNFSKPGFECRHNLGYWNMDPYIGIGPGAVSSVPGGSTGVIRINNHEDFKGFINHNDFEQSFCFEEISKTDFLFENLLMGFRKQEGINKDLFKKRFGNNLEYFAGDIWKTWINDGYADENNDFYFLKEKGRLFLNTLLRDVIGNLKEPDVINWP